MSEKFGTLLKDFIIYVIPGFLITTCIIQLYGKLELITNLIKDNLNIAIVGLFFSFIIGFLSSQLQLVIFNILKGEKTYTLNDVIDNEPLKDRILAKFIETTGIDISQKKILPESSNIRSFCNQYTTNFGNSESLNLIQRANYLASFSITLVIPTILCLATTLMYFQVKYISIITIIFSCLLLILVNKIFHNFEKSRVSMIFYTFLAISSNPKKELKAKNKEEN